MMALINNVPGDDLGNGTKPFSPSWTSFFEQIFNILSAITQSGTTAQRPTKFLWIGRNYFDTTKGYPIYVKSVGPVVWVNGAGTVV
jgi:hypothetical protein